MHHVTQNIFVLMVGIDVNYIEMGVGEALDALDGSRPNDTHARHVREPADDGLIVLLLMRIGIIPVMLPVHPSSEVAEILASFTKRIVLVGIKLPIIYEVI